MKDGCGLELGAGAHSSPQHSGEIGRWGATPVGFRGGMSPVWNLNTDHWFVHYSIIFIGTSKDYMNMSPINK